VSGFVSLDEETVSPQSITPSGGGPVPRLLESGCRVYARGVDPELRKWWRSQESTLVHVGFA